MANGNEPYDDEDGDGTRSSTAPREPAKTPPATEPAKDDEGEKESDAHERGDEPSGQRFVLNLGKRKVAVGLKWRQVLDDGEAWDFAKDAQSEGYDLWRYVDGTEPQLALGKRSYGHRAGMPMLAAELASQYPGQWAGLFEVDEAFYVTAVSADIIDPDADVAFSTFEEAYLFYEDIATRSAGLKRLVSTSLLSRVSMPGVEPADLDNLEFSFANTLQAVSNTKRYLAYGIPVAVLLISAFAVVKFAPELIDAAKLRLGLTPKQEKQQIVIPPAPWAGQPKAEVMLANCLDAVRSVPHEAFGWVAASITCDGRVVQVAVQRTGVITEGAPPISWLDRWTKVQPELVTRKGVKLGKPTLAPMEPTRPNVGMLTWRMPPVRLADRWRDANRPSAGLDGEARALWTAMEDKFLKVQFTPVQDQPYFQTRGARIEMGFHQENQVSPAIRKPGTYMNLLTMDPKTLNVIADVRMGLAKPFPTDENIEVVRSPAVSTTEGAALPPRPSR